jgi:hypothetical protein
MSARTSRRRYRPSLPPKPQPRPAPAPDVFDWLPERELVVGSGKTTRDDVMARLATLYGPSSPKDSDR